MTEGMKNLWNSSTEAKVAIVGAFYELEQLFASSNRTGAALKQFSTLTGMSAQTLQQYQYAAQQVVGHNVELADTFSHMQKSLQLMTAGQGSGGFQSLGMLVGALNRSGIKTSMDEAKQWMTNIPLLIQKMQQVAMLPNVKDIWKRHILEGMGAQGDLIEALMLKGLTPNKIAAAKPFTYSDKEVDRLTRASTAWANMSTAMEMSVGRFNAQYGPQMAENIERIVKALLGPNGLVPALVKLSDQLHAFDGFNRVLQGITSNIDELTKLSHGDIKGFVNAWTGMWKGLLFPSLPSGSTTGSNRTVNVHAPVTTHVHSSAAMGAAQVGDIVGHRVQKVFMQIPTLMQSN